MATGSLVTPDLLQRLSVELDAEILAHSERTAELAVQLAEHHGVDPERARLAALIHDIADRYSDRELLILAERYGVDVSLAEARVPKLLHGKIGAEVLRRDWGITDDELLDTVRDHITGGIRMGPLAKVLFVADKLEPDRDRSFGALDPIRRLAMVNLEAAMLKLYAWRIDQLLGAGKQVDEAVVKARNQLIEGMPGSS
jgi:predicted HD superfamily hydrolase involved in NAD metabolism